MARRHLALAPFLSLVRRGDPGGGLHNTAGIAIMLVSVFFFTLMDATAKYLTQYYPPPMVIWARFFGNFVVLLLVLRGRMVPALRSRQPLLQVGRAVTQMLSLALFVFALRSIGLAEATAIGEIGPAFIALFAALLLGEKIGPRRITGIAVAMIGALIIIRPGVGVFQPAALLPALGAMVYGFGAVLTRMARSDSVETSLVWTIGIGTIVTSCIVPLFWVPIAAEHVWGFCLIGVLGAAGQALLIRAFTLAEAAAVAPFGYTGLIWAGLWGFLFWGTIPDIWVATGAAIIVGAGLYIWWREVQAARAAEGSEADG